jgi:Flp pilus assembly pilin Flp
MGLMKEFWDNEDGIGVVEIVLILVKILTTYYGVSIRCIG